MKSFLTTTVLPFIALVISFTIPNTSQAQTNSTLEGRMISLPNTSQAQTNSMLEERIQNLEKLSIKILAYETEKDSLVRIMEAKMNIFVDWVRPLIDFQAINAKIPGGYIYNKKPVTFQNKNGLDTLRRYPTWAEYVKLRRN